MIVTIFAIGCASGLNLLKVYFIAWHASPAVFGNYITYLSLSTFLGLLFSFGMAEDTIKKYPFLSANNQLLSIKNDLLLKSKNVLIRFIVFYLICVLVTSIYKSNIFPFAIVALLSFLSFQNSLCSSFIRSQEKKILLSAFFFGKAFLAFAFIYLVVPLNNYDYLLISEIVALVLTNIACFLYLHKLSKKQNHASVSIQTKKNHYNISLYLIFILSTFISNTDKYLVSLALGPDQVALYSVILLLPQIFQNIINVISQYFSARLIRDANNINCQNKIKKFVLKVILMYCSLIFITFLLVYVFQCNFVEAKLFKNYFVSHTQLTLAGLISFCQITSLIEFISIGKNKEKYLLSCYFVSAITYLLFFGFALYFRLGLNYYLLGVFFSKLLPLICNIFFIEDKLNIQRS